MSYVHSHQVDVTTDALGDAVAYSEEISGKISQIRYVATDFAAGVDFAITSERTGQIVWSEANVNASTTRAPRQATHDVTGVPALYAVGGAPVLDKIAIDRERIKFIIAQGGAMTSGTFYITME